MSLAVRPDLPASRKHLVVIAAVLFVVEISAKLQAATVRSWAGASASSGNWSTSANWQNSQPPVSGDTLLFPNSGARRTSNTNNFPAGTVFSAITFGDTGYRLRGNSVTLSNSVNAALNSGTNTIDLNISAGQFALLLRTFASADRLILNGDINLNARTLTTEGPGDFVIGGVISGTGGIVKNNTGDLSLSGVGANTFAGTTIVNGGILRLNRFNLLGSLSDGLDIIVTFGTVAIPGDLIIGSGTGGLIGDVVALDHNNQIANTSDVTVNGSGSLELSDENDAISSLTLLGGTVLTGAGTLTLGGNVRVNAGTKDSFIAGNLNLGAGAQRIFDVVQGAQLNVNAQISGGAGISLVKSNRGELFLSASNLFNGPAEIVGGTLSISHGAALGTANGATVLRLGTLAIDTGIGVNEPLDVQGPSATLALNAASASWNGPVMFNDDLFISVPTNVFLTITGPISGPAGFRKTGEGTLQFKTTYTNTYAGTGWVEHGDMILDGVFHQPVLSGPLVIGNATGTPGRDRVSYIKQQQIGDTVAVTINQSGLLALNGLNDTIGSLQGSGGVSLGSGSLTVGANNSSTLFSGVIDGTGSLVKTGLATLTLTGTNTYSGVTTNLSGTLLVNGILSGSPVVQVRPGSVLGGTGQVQSISVFTSGLISPGNSPGNLTAAGSVLLSSGALKIELNGLTPGTGYDRLTTAGTITLGGALNVSLGFVPAVGDSFTILNKTSAGSITGTFSGLAEGATFIVDGMLWRITYLGGTGNDIVLTRLAVPASHISSITPVTSERMQILGQGLAGVAYVLDATAHLNAPIPWSPIATNTANGFGIYQFIDAYADQGMLLYPMRFYRVKSQ